MVTTAVVFIIRLETCFTFSNGIYQADLEKTKGLYVKTEWTSSHPCSVSLIEKRQRKQTSKTIGLIPKRQSDDSSQYLSFSCSDLCYAFF